MLLAGNCSQQQQTRTSRAAPAAPCRAARHKAGAALWAQPCGPPRDDPVRLVSPCAPAGPAVGPGISHAGSGRWIQAAPQMLHIKITSVMCFYFPPEEMSAPLLPSLPSLHQHIFVRLQPHFSFLQSILLCSRVPLFLMTDRANDGPGWSVMPTGRHGVAALHAGVGIQGFNLQRGVFVLSFLKWFEGILARAAGSLMQSKQ